MTDKQQIEELAKIVSTDCIIKDKEQMARIIAFDLCKQSYHSDWYGNEAQCYSDNNFHDCKKIKAVVDKLYNAGYRRVGENAVVLSREELSKRDYEFRQIGYDECLRNNPKKDIYIKALERKIDQLNAKLDQARKETATDFIFKVESYLGYNDDNETFTKKELLLILAEVAKEQYGVEVEDNGN